MGEGQDTEITLGTGKLLGMFFGLVAICAVFFGLGYSLGRNNANRIATAIDTAPQPVPAPTAAKPTATKPSAQPAANVNAPSTSDELTFYRSVEQKDTTPQLPAAAPGNGTAPSSASAPVSSAPELTKPAPGAYIVQVAAVSKKEDADILLGALQKKQYPVFITTADDKLFHVQVGPFSDQKEAESMKLKLTADGYSPILKR